MRLLFAWNILDVARRLVGPKDDLSDIALTPDQRKLLGLAPNTPLKITSPEQHFQTPPRYTKATTTSRNSSPLPMPSVTSPKPPGTASGLAGFISQQKLPETPGAGSNRAAWASPSPRAGSVFGSPTPNRMGSSGLGGSSSITPSNRWAYEKSALRKCK